MATAAEWAEGYRQQALRDLVSAELVQGVEPSVLAMLLQMTYEKLGKAALLLGGQLSVDDAQRSHVAATTMMRLLAGSRRKADALGIDRAVIQSKLLPLVDQLEGLNPSVVRRRGGAGPWLEYPWEDATHVVRWPARDLPFIAALHPRQGVRTLWLVDVARTLCARLDVVFG